MPRAVISGYYKNTFFICMKLSKDKLKYSIKINS